jgi:hypothetical protein
MNSEQDAFHELCGYTLTRGDSAFVHQHVVDAFAAQTADDKTKPVKLTFALVGLYLHIERHFSGREVQRVHMNLGKRKEIWPVIPLPRDRGDVIVADVLAAPEGESRDRAINLWCGSVWRAFGESRQTVVDLLRANGVPQSVPDGRGR